MITFDNDYSEIAAPEILTALQRYSGGHYVGYGLDEICGRAAELIRREVGRPDADIHFLEGGTSANQIMIAAMLKPYQAVAAADNGHINVHEAGAIEATGHKIEPVPGRDGKLTAEGLGQLCAERQSEHMVRLGAAFLSHPSELGTVYSLKELRAIREVCDRNDLYLYVDGARLGSALTCGATDVTLKDLGELADAFYIGGTKNGAMLGEAMVILNDRLKPGFRNLMKSRGGMAAKGYVIGIQFETLFTDGLYYRLARHANQMAALLKQGLVEKGAALAVDSCTNQQFVYLTAQQVDAVKDRYRFSPFGRDDQGRLYYRLVASWATREEDVRAFLKDLPAQG